MKVKFEYTIEPRISVTAPFRYELFLNNEPVSRGIARDHEDALHLLKYDAKRFLKIRDMKSRRGSFTIEDGE